MLLKLCIVSIDILLHKFYLSTLFECLNMVYEINIIKKTNPKKTDLMFVIQYKPERYFSQGSVSNIKNTNILPN